MKKHLTKGSSISIKMSVKTDYDDFIKDSIITRMHRLN